MQKNFAPQNVLFEEIVVARLLILFDLVKYEIIILDSKKETNVEQFFFWGGRMTFLYN